MKPHLTVVVGADNVECFHVARANGVDIHARSTVVVSMAGEPRRVLIGLRFDADTVFYPPESRELVRALYLPAFAYELSK